MLEIAEEWESIRQWGGFTLMVEKDKVETGESQAELDLAKENKQTLAGPTAKQIIWKQGNNYQGCGIQGGEGRGGFRDLRAKVGMTWINILPP